MRLYTYLPNSERHAYIYAPQEAEELLFFREIVPRSTDWPDIVLKADERNLPLGDFPALYGPTPVFSERAWSVFRKHLEGTVEALPLRHPSGITLYAINVLLVLDCLDWDRSKLSKNPVNGRITHISRYHFKEVRFDQWVMFKLPETAGLKVIVTDRFKQLVEDAGLKGLSFHRAIYEGA